MFYLNNIIVSEMYSQTTIVLLHYVLKMIKNIYVYLIKICRVQDVRMCTRLAKTYFISGDSEPRAYQFIFGREFEKRANPKQSFLCIPE